MAKNIIIGQSGGPTAVINSSLAGVYKAARSLGADTVYGMKYGIEGLLKEELLELNVLLDDRLSSSMLMRSSSRTFSSMSSSLSRPSMPYFMPYTLSAPRLQAALYTPARLELMTAVGPPL